MVEISASLVKQLRERTGVGMMDCKKALNEVNGDLEKAIDWLRKQGLSSAAKKAGRITSDGLIGVLIDNKKAAIAEINSETDFVARNKVFQDYVTNIVRLAIKVEGNFEKLMSSDYPNTSRNVEEELNNLISVIGENLTFRRVDFLSVNNGLISSYIHNSLSSNLGKIGVLVAIESESGEEKIKKFTHQLAMHIAASNPQSITVEALDPELISREKKILEEKAKSSRKPDFVIEKMVEGGLRKFYEQVVLLEQNFIMDNKVKVKDIIKNFVKELGSPIEIKKFVRFELGEGIEKKES